MAFLGAGRMATALAKGLLGQGFERKRLSAFDVSNEASSAFFKATGVACGSSVDDVLKPADVVLLAVKPQNIEACLGAARNRLHDKLLVSIVAGVKVAALTKLSGCDRIVRAMPNTPALVGAGITAMASSTGMSSKDVELARSILGAVGEVLALPEHLLDAVTGLSGSGPAYVFDFIQGLVDGGVRSGLPRDAAFKLALQTVSGAAKLLADTGEHPAVLRDQVTSPGGTTASGLSVLERGSFRGLVSQAVYEAANRSRELGGG